MTPSRWISPLRPVAVEQLEDGAVELVESRVALTLSPGTSGMVNVPRELLVDLLEASGYERAPEAEGGTW